MFTLVAQMPCIAAVALPAADCGRLYRTLGYEFEEGALEYVWSATQGLENTGMFRLAARGLNAHLIANSKFRSLYGVFGKNKEGKFVQGLIPSEVLSSPRLRDLMKKHASWFQKKDGDVFLTHWADLTADELTHLTETILGCRGKNSSAVKLMKIPSAWRENPEPLDDKIPETLSEEWRERNGEYQFVGFEFPMVGGVDKKKDLEDYAVHLISRMGYFPELSDRNIILSGSVGHVHWVTNPSALKGTSEEKKREIYQAIHGYWGDTNDHLTVNDAVLRKQKVGLETALNAFSSRHVRATSDSIGLLTRSIYDLVRPTANGMVVTDANAPRGTKEMNFPVSVKSLPLGMRGIYGQAKIAPGAPIPIVGLEARNELTIDSSLKRLPAVWGDGNEVDLNRLLAHKQAGGRGLEDNPAALNHAAQRVGLEGKIFDEFERAYREEEKYALQTKSATNYVDRMRALTFLPINFWLEHPKVIRSLSLKTPADRKAWVENYQKRQSDYVRRLNLLLKARTDSTFDFSPEWDIPLEKAKDGINRFFPRPNYPQDSSDLITPDRPHSRIEGVFLSVIPPDRLFLAALSVEAGRFVRDTGLDEVLAAEP